MTYSKIQNKTNPKILKWTCYNKIKVKEKESNLKWMKKKKAKVRIGKTQGLN